jgi:hypothetical protein
MVNTWKRFNYYRAMLMVKSNFKNNHFPLWFLKIIILKRFKQELNIT